jgi:Fe-S cluster biogenesis protein NfuA
MSAEGLERQTRNYLSNNIPQIQEHGGHFEIEDVDDDSGVVTVAIGGACSGCGIAPMTMKAIEQRLPSELDGVSEVTVRRAGGPRAAVMPSKIPEMEEMEEYEDYDPPF